LSFSHETSRPRPRIGAQLPDRAAAWLRARLRLDVPRFITLLSLSALASLFLPRATWASTDESWIWAFAVLTVLSIVLEFIAVELPRGGEVSVATIGHIATILLVPAPFAAISVGFAVLVEELIHRRPIQRIAFNTACHVLTISLASLAVSLIGDPRVLIAERDHLALVTMVVVVSVVYHLVNDVLMSAIVALSTGRPLLYLIRTNGRSTVFAEAGAGVIGVLFALIWVIEPLWTTLLAIPGAVIARSLQYIRQLERETRSAVGSLAQVVDDRDGSTFRHSARVAGHAVAIATELGLDEDLVELIEQAASVHDLGKIGVPDRVLLKPGPLTAEEQTTMWLHTEIGSRILGQFHLFRSGAEIVLHHHEAFDGSGYPKGLAGEAIPLGARVVAVADALDAMSSDRPYRDALSHAETISRLRAGAGRQWDPRIVDAALTLIANGRIDLEGARIADRGHHHDHPDAADLAALRVRPNGHGRRHDEPTDEPTPGGPRPDGDREDAA
jgi:HD-GYP domain-containing protein (c-di-GMP phosphodiesterase class II)